MSYSAASFIGKEIVGLEDGKNYGRVVSVLFDSKLTAMLYFKTEKYTVPSSSVFRISDCICVLRNKDFTPLPVCSPISASVFTSSGKKVGVCKDVDLTSTFNVRYLLCEETKIFPKRVLTVGDSIILKAAMPKQNTLKIPSRYSGDFSFLIGTRITAKIYDRNGELIATTGQIVNSQIIRSCRANEKLIELTKKCVTIKPNV